MKHCLAALALLLPLLTQAQPAADLRVRSVFVEGEDFTPVGADWAAGKGWADDIYTATSGDAVLANGGGKGEARAEVTVPAEGTYNVWVRYLKIGAYAGTFRLRALRGEQVLFDGEYRTRAEGGGWDPVWEKFEAKLPAGALTLSLTIGKPGIRQRVDCVLLTPDLAYQPNYRDFAPQTFLRLKLLSPVVPVTVHVRTYCKREPVYYHDPGTLTSAGLGQAGEPLAPGAWSPWIELSKYMDSGKWQTTVKLSYASGGKPLERVEAVYEVSPTGEAATARALREQVEGEISSLILPGDMRKYPEVVTLASVLTAKHLADAKALRLPPPGKEPRLPLEVYVSGFGDAYRSRQMLTQELTVARLLGANSFNDFFGVRRQAGEAAGYRRGFLSQWFTHQAWACPTAAGLPQMMDDHFKALAAKILAEDPQAFTLNARNMLYDEPGTSNLKHLQECPSCLAAFAPYLRQQGLTPQDLGQQSWEAVKPIAREAATNAATRTLHYWTIQFRDWTNANVVKLGNDAAEKHFGKQILNTINFTDGPISGWSSALAEGPDWFLYGRLRSVGLMWSEDWASLGPEVSGLITDLLRAAGRPHALPVGEYLIANNNATLTQRTFSALMRGAKTLHFYCYGPYYAFCDGMIADNAETQRTVARTTRLIGAADPYLYPAQVPPAQVAILWGKSHEIWQNDAAVGTERRSLYLACAHAHVPVDLVSEYDLADGLLSTGKYRVLYVAESNLSRAAYTQVLKWVAAGGVLQLSPGALQYDEYNAPLAGPPAPVEKPGGDYREHYGIPHQAVRGEVVLPATKYWPACTMPVLGYRETLSAADATVLASFADGKPAVLLTRRGKGTILRFGFMPGLAYVRSAQPKATEVITGYQATQRPVLTAAVALAGVQAPLAVSEPLVEARLLRGPQADVVVLANWSGGDLPAVTVTVRGAGARRARAASGAACQATRVKADLVVTLPLGAAEVLVLPR